MHIKRVSIVNFVSYDDFNTGAAEGAALQQLSPGLNLLLGANGSGKSNFLQGKTLHVVPACLTTHSLC